MTYLDGFHDLPICKSISFEKAKEKCGISYGDWVITPSLKNHFFWKIYSPSMSNENTYDIRHCGSSRDSKSSLYVNREKVKKIIKSEDIVEKINLKKQILKMNNSPK